MPYVNVRIAREGATPEQKRRVIEGVTRVVSEVLGKKPGTVSVVIDEIDPDNWGVGGESLADKWRREKDGPVSV